MALAPITPGSSPQFQLIPEPAGIPTSIDNIGWAAESSDATGDVTDVTMTSNPDDLTGMTATLAIDLSVAVGTIITFWAVYRNTSGNETLAGPWNYPVVAG